MSVCLSVCLSLSCLSILESVDIVDLFWGISILVSLTIFWGGRLPFINVCVCWGGGGGSDAPGEVKGDELLKLSVWE